MDYSSAEYIGGAAVRALLYELAATPKPGLVDQANAGAHSDMNYFTFLDSITALAPYFTAVAREGISRRTQRPQTLFRALRPIGKRAEETMLAATGGVNTHKGAVFTLGVLCAAAGSAAGRGKDFSAKELCAFGGKMTAGLCATEYANLQDKAELTKGERIYLEHHVGGVRAEAENGFPSVINIGYPVLTEALLKRGAPFSRALPHTLLYLMANVNDTNVLGRRGKTEARYVKGQAAMLCEHGGGLTAGGIEQLRRLDEDFIARNISPGGCADLLAASLLLFFLCHPDFKTAG